MSPQGCSVPEKVITQKISVFKSLNTDTRL